MVLFLICEAVQINLNSIFQANIEKLRVFPQLDPLFFNASPKLTLPFSDADFQEIKAFRQIAQINPSASKIYRS